MASIEADLENISIPDVSDELSASANEEQVDSASIVEFPQRAEPAASGDEGLGLFTESESKDDSAASDLDKLFADEISAESLFTSDAVANDDVVQGKKTESQESTKPEATDSEKDWLTPDDDTENVMSVPDSGLELEDTPFKLPDSYEAQDPPLINDAAEELTTSALENTDGVSVEEASTDNVSG